jgi:hypothetical protein
MLALLLFLFSAMLGLRLIGVAADEKGKEDWHWWLIGLGVIGAGYGLGILFQWLFGYSFTISIGEKLELSVLGMILAALGLYGVYQFLREGNLSKNIEELASKIDEMGKDKDN